ncbi:MAG: 5-formyltetrahydrofolate cyclo-ligase [Thiomicrorhabdus sp.]|nr:5-formyltetrahydrofolate cyclo-ligase [Thiomicrorhabdus sp.]
MTDSLDSTSLRTQLRLQRQALNALKQQQHAQLAQQNLQQFLTHLLLSQPHKILNIAFFLAQDGELETAYAIQYLWQCTPHKLFLPKLNSTPHDGYMTFAEYTLNSTMKPNKFGILEPISDKNPLSGEALDLVLTPLVGFDSNGNRMGMGGGYYDRTFQFKQQSTKMTSPLLIGWAHDCQQVSKLPVNPWDIPLNGIITETGFTDFSR